jgi:hypothetical protein
MNRRADDVIEWAFRNAAIDGCEVTLRVINCRGAQWLAQQLRPHVWTAAKAQSRAIRMKASLNSSVSASSAHRRHSSANFLYSWAVAMVGPHEGIAHEKRLNRVPKV